MNRQPSLATRAFLFAFLPLALTLIVSFIAINKVVEGRIKARLRDSLHRSEKALSKRERDFSQRRLKLLSVVTENPSLKAGLGLLGETRTPELQEQVNATLAGQLGQLAKSLEYDLLLMEDPADKPIVGVLGANRTRLDLPTARIDFIAPSLIRIQNVLYESTSVPINLESENLGTLILGRTFDIHAWSELGHATLFRDGKVFITTFPAEKALEAERQLQKRCGNRVEECEIELAGENYLALAVRKETFSNNVSLVSFQSIDAAASEFTQSIADVFPLIGAGGVLLVCAFSFIGSRYIAKPLVDLIQQLHRGGASGGFATELATDYQAAEVNELAMEFTRAAGAVRESERRLDEATEEFIQSMAQAQDARDPYTAGHSERVSINSTAIAVALGLSREQVEIIRIGAKLHDIGKIGIPDAVLRKPAKLTKDEYALIQKHPQIGREILEKVGRFKDFLPIVELHHENPDGSGYPYGLRESEIPIGVRIVHVADVYDAITTDRAYRKAMSEARAWDLLVRGRGTLFDADVVEALWTVIRKEKMDVPSLKSGGPHENDSAFYSLPTV